MKTPAVFLMAVLYALSLNVKSNAYVSFGTEVLVEQTFSEKDLNVTVTSGTIATGQTIVLGKHNDYLRAMKDKHIITGNTTNKAEVVAFFGIQKISLEDAFALLNNYNIYETATGQPLTDNKNTNFHYSIELLTSETQNLQAYLKVCPELEKMVVQKDENIFLIGHLTSYNKVVALQEKLVAAGLKNNVIVAYEGNKQVPVYRLAKN